MGLSFHDEKSMVESTAGSMRFALGNPNSILDSPIEDASTVRQESRDDDIGIRLSGNIQMEDR